MQVHHTLVYRPEEVWPPCVCISNLATCRSCQCLFIGIRVWRPPNTRWIIGTSTGQCGSILEHHSMNHLAPGMACRQTKLQLSWVYQPNKYSISTSILWAQYKYKDSMGTVQVSQILRKATYIICTDNISVSSYNHSIASRIKQNLTLELQALDLATLPRVPTQSLSGVNGRGH